MPINQIGWFPSGSIPDFHRIEGNRAVLDTDYKFIEPNGTEHVAKAGLIYDGASIPKLLWGLSTNPWADDVIGPATIHDYYCKLGRLGESPLDSDDVHYLFYLGLKAINVSEWRARARWLAVKLKGPKFKKAQ